MASRFLTLLYVCFFIISKTQSQDYIFNRFSIQDGLLSNNVLCVWQDAEGFIWLGSENGLQRFDGNTFRTILHHRVDQIISDNKTRVWIRTGKKLGIFDPKIFSLYYVDYESSTSANNKSALQLNKDALGRVYLSGSNCQYFDEVSGAFSSKSNPFLLPDSLKLIDAVFDTKKERYWILSDKGLGYWDNKTNAFYTRQNNPQRDALLSNKKLPQVVSRFFIDNTNRYWIEDAFGANFLCYNATKNQFTNDTTGLFNAGNGSYFEVNKLATYNDTLPTLYGLNCLRMNNGRGFRELRDNRNSPYGIQFNIVSDILQDKERILWIATDNGLYYTIGDLRKTIHVIFSQEKSRGSVKALLEDKHKRLWIGTWGRGVFVINTEVEDGPRASQVEQLIFKDDFTNLVWSICEERESGDLWIGCEKGRLIHYSPEIKNSSLYRPEIFNNSNILQIVANEKGKLWFGLDNGDLIKKDDPSTLITIDSFRKVFHFNGAITKLFFKDSRLLWVTVKGQGAYLFDTITKKIIQSFDTSNIQRETITTLNEIIELNDSLYFAAGQQPAILNIKTPSIYLNGVLNNFSTGNIFTAQKDASGDCWIGGANGIFRFNFKSKLLTQYSQHDGLFTIHNNSYIPETSIRLTDNRLVFAGNQHLVVFDPAQYRSPKPPSDVIITGFQLNNHYVAIDSLKKTEKIKIPYTQNSFNIAFASISFLQLGKLIYEYKMEGIDKDWITTKMPGLIKYNFLPPGHYRFLVRVKNDEGIYAPNTTSVLLYVVPPFWKTIWFYLLLTAITAAILFYLHRLRLKRLLHVERVRSRLARDLHDDLGSTLSTINIISNIAIHQSPLDEKSSKGYMQTIGSSTTQMMDAMDDIVWSINPINDTMSKVLARMKEAAGAILEPAQIEYRFDVDKNVMDIHFPMEMRREIFLIFKEALNNIIKYADCTTVVFTLNRTGKDFKLIIEDNGKGFEATAPHSSARGNGIINMKKRAENINGWLQVSSQLDKGTSITLATPIA